MISKGWTHLNHIVIQIMEMSHFKMNIMFTVREVLGLEPKVSVCHASFGAGQSSVTSLEVSL